MVKLESLKSEKVQFTYEVTLNIEEVKLVEEKNDKQRNNDLLMLNT